LSDCVLTFPFLFLFHVQLQRLLFLYPCSLLSFCAQVYNATHMHFNYVRTSSSEVFDDVWIVKNSHA